MKPRKIFTTKSTKFIIKGLSALIRKFDDVFYVKRPVLDPHKYRRRNPKVPKV